MVPLPSSSDHSSFLRDFLDCWLSRLLCTSGTGELRVVPMISEPLFDLASANEKPPPDAVSGQGIGAGLDDLVALRARDPQQLLKLPN